MKNELDIFKVNADGSILWKGTAESLEVARLSIKTLAETSPADYMIVDPRTGEQVLIKGSRSPSTIR